MESKQDQFAYQYLDTPKFRMVLGSWLGARKQQEDRAKFTDHKLFALASVFDGHGGAQVSDYCAQHFHDFLLQKCLLPQEYRFHLEQEKSVWDPIFTKVYKEFDQEIREKVPSSQQTQGTTASTWILHKPTNLMFLVYIGDSRVAYSIRRSRQKEQGATVDHDVDNEEEKARVQEHLSWQYPGYVMCKNQYMLNVFRAFGDFHCKRSDGSGILALPEILDFDCMNCTKGTTFVLASDGYWKGIKHLPNYQVPFAKCQKFTDDAQHNQKLLHELFFTPDIETSQDNVTVMLLLWK